MKDEIDSRIEFLETMKKFRGTKSQQDQVRSELNAKIWEAQEILQKVK